MDYKIKDIELCTIGEQNINLAMSEMPGLLGIIDDYKSSPKPLKGARIAGCLHMTAETAVLIHTLVELGADVRWCSSNQYSTSDKAAAAIAARGIPVYAWFGETEEEFKWCMDQVLFGDPLWSPNMILDDGAELATHITLKCPELFKDIKGITEETTSGLFELKKLESHGNLFCPAIVVNNSITKSKFDNIYGCHESMMHAIKNSTGMLIAGKTATVIGYGEVGKGCARSLKGSGARVQIIEIDPICALQASMDGFEVVSMEEASKKSHIFVTATGNKNVISHDNMVKMRDKVILCNMGNFNNEIDISSLQKYDNQQISDTLTRYNIGENKSLFVIGHGAPANLSCADGHSSFIMSTSFSNQVLAQIELWANNEMYPCGVHTLPRKLDEHVARLHLQHLGAKLSLLTNEQADYIGVSTSGPFKPDFYRY